MYIKIKIIYIYINTHTYIIKEKFMDWMGGYGKNWRGKKEG